MSSEYGKLPVASEPLPSSARQPGRFFVFGRSPAELSSLIADERFHRLVRPLFAGSRTDADAGEPILASALRHGLLEHEEEGVGAGPQLTLVPEPALEGCSLLLRPYLDAYTRIVARHAEELRRVYTSCGPAVRFGWRAVEPVLVAGALCDLATGVELERTGTLSESTGSSYAVWGFETSVGPDAFGVQVAGGPGRSFLAQLWWLGVPRPLLRVARTDVAGLVAAAEGEPVRWPEDRLLYLRYLRLLRAENGSDPVLNLAVFQPEDTRRLLPVLAAGAEELLGRALRPALEALAEAPWWRDRYEQESVRYAAVRLLLDLGTHRLVTEGHLSRPRFGSVEPSWGRWLWREPVDAAWTLLRTGEEP